MKSMKPVFSIYRHRQRGVALLVTLIILVVVTFMGLVAMRSGLLSVTMSTNSQVDTLLFEGADAGVTAVANKINSSLAIANGPTGLITLAKDNPGTEVLTCLKSAGLDVTISMASPKRCDLDEANNFISGRSVTVVQTSLVAPKDASGKAQTMPTYGSDDAVLPGGGSAMLVTYSTSVIPSFGATTVLTAEGCLAKNQQDAVDGDGKPIETVTGCLLRERASFQTVVQEFAYGYPGYK